MSRSAFAFVAVSSLLWAVGCGGSTDENPITAPVVAEEALAAQAVSLAGASTLALFEPFYAGEPNLLAGYEKNPGPVTTPEQMVLVKEVITTKVEPSCATVEWNDELRVTFAGCDFARPGLTISGAMELRFMAEPVEVELVLDQMQVDQTTFDGIVALEFHTVDGRLTAALTGDVTFSTGGVDMRMLLDRFSVTLLEGGATMRGTVEIESDRFSGRSSTSELILQSGECAPLGGSIQLELDGRDRVSISYLMKTPSTGEVDLLAGGRLFSDQPLLEPCD